MSSEKKFFSKRVTYKIVSVLKAEGAVKVYKALRGPLSCQQEVILKIFPRRSKLFLLEWESLSLASSLSCCARLLNVEFFKGKNALVLESIKGVTLWELIRHYHLSQKEINHLMNQIHKGLKELASQNLFHGDLSLSNILITTRGEMRFIDFGKGNRKAKGTFPFIAPEILKGGGSGLAADLFSLGVIGFFLENPHKLNSLKDKDPEYFTADTPLLQEDPGKRYFPANNYKDISVSSLNHKVEELLQIKESCWQTKDFPDSPLVFPFVRRFVFLVGIWLFLSFAANTMSSAKWVSKEGLLTIHTSQWFHITLNSFKGYTPVQMPLSSGHYKLLWKSRDKQGEKLLYIPPGKTLVLNDRDFLR